MERLGSMGTYQRFLVGESQEITVSFLTSIQAIQCGFPVSYPLEQRQVLGELMGFAYLLQSDFKNGESVEMRWVERQFTFEAAASGSHFFGRVESTGNFNLSLQGLSVRTLSRSGALLSESFTHPGAMALSEAMESYRKNSLQEVGFFATLDRRGDGVARARAKPESDCDQQMNRLCRALGEFKNRDLADALEALQKSLGGPVQLISEHHQIFFTCRCTQEAVERARMTSGDSDSDVVCGLCNRIYPNNSFEKKSQN